MSYQSKLRNHPDDLAHLDQLPWVDGICGVCGRNLPVTQAADGPLCRRDAHGRLVYQRADALDYGAGINHRPDLASAR